MLQQKCNNNCTFLFNNLYPPPGSNQRKSRGFSLPLIETIFVMSQMFGAHLFFS